MSAAELLRDMNTHTTYMLSLFQDDLARRTEALATKMPRPPSTMDYEEVEEYRNVAHMLVTAFLNPGEHNSRAPD